MNALREPGVGRFRPMLYADVKEVLAIERRVYDFAWTEGILRDCLRAGYHCRVLETPHGFIQAYAVMSAAAGEAHLLNLCVRPESQGRGLAQRLLEHLLAWARSERVKTIFLEVRLSNTRAVQLYASAGFCEVGLRLGYYPSASGREDALVMAREL